jgi:autotransporter-associated beta strand protein
MKPKSTPFRNSVAGALIIAATFSLANHSQAAGGDWNVDADGFWNTPSNWNPAVVPGTTAGDAVNLTFDITTAAKTVTIDTAVRLGTLNIGDPDGSHAYTLALTSGSLNFDNGASAAQLTKTIGFNAATISAPAALDGNLSVSNVTNGNLNLDGIISNGVNGAKSVTISNSGAGITTLNGANSFSGGLTVKQGTVSGSTSASAFGGAGILLGDTSGSANAALKDDGTLAAGLTYTNPITVQSGSSGNTLTIRGRGDLKTTTFSGGIAVNRDLTLDNNGGTLIGSTGAGALTGLGNLTITNTSATPDLRAHRVAINTANPSFSGGIDILTGGTLRVGNVTALSASNTVKVRFGGLFEINAAPLTIGGLNDESGSGGLVSLTGGDRTLTLGGSGSYSFNGNIEDYTVPSLRKLSLVKSGTGTQALGGTNAYSGNTTLNGGLLKLNSANALPGGIGATGGTSALLFSGGGVIGLTAASGDFNRAIKEVDIPLGVNQVGWTTSGGQGGFAAFGGDRSVNFGGAAAPITWIPNQGILGSVFILGHSSADSKVTVVNPINLNFNTRTVFVNDGSAPVDAELAGLITGSGALNKDGTGTLDLTANNTYGAHTNVLAGTLRIKGLQNGDTSTVTVSSGATLVLESTGQLTFKPTTNGVSNKITGDGTAILNGTLLIKPAAADLTNGNSWTIVDAVGATSNLAAVASFPALTWTESPSGVWKAVDGSKTWTYTESSGTLGLVVSASVNYDSWAIANGISGAAFTDDADNDGIDNGTEYAIGGIPTSFTAPAALVPSGADFTLTYAKGTEAAADPQIDYVFETSPDLGTWTEVAPTSENASSVSYTLVKSGPARFVRLKIVRIIP